MGHDEWCPICDSYTEPHKGHTIEGCAKEIKAKVALLKEEVSDLQDALEEARCLAERQET